jgi:6-pyruvoyltetrahydropterin/6-carboxytetrahydropterin synthase
MRYELTQEFYFDASHTLERSIDGESSRRIHGHTYHVEVTVSGIPDGQTGMLIDLGEFRRALSGIRETLDHRLLDEIRELGVPTLERLCSYIGNSLKPTLPALSSITVARRASGDRCTLDLDGK